VWNVEASIWFEGLGKGAKASLYIPKNTARFNVMDENFISNGFSLSTGIKDFNRQAIWTARKTEGRQNLYYRSVVRVVEKSENVLYKQPDIDDPGFEGAALEAANAVLAEITPKNSSALGVTQTLLQLIKTPAADENLKMLLGKNPSALAVADTAVRILALAEIPARVVHGVDLNQAGKVTEPLIWIEIFENKRWFPLDLQSAKPAISENYFPWWKGSDPLLTIEGGEKFHSSIAVEPRQEQAIENALAGVDSEGPSILKYSLFSLPIQSQMVYRILMMIPFGALVVVLLRNVIGIRTFGTFMPILVALAFRETELFWGIVFFVVLVSAGLLMRTHFDRLHLLLVPRLASILTVIVLMMAVISVITNKLGIGHGLSVALFPMVIMTMTVERMSIVWDELGSWIALRQGFGTLAVASLIYLLINIPYLEHLFFVFPELVLVILALNLILGRYTGFRLLELKRFRDLIKG